MITPHRRVLINQGGLFCSSQPCTISTVLGSCIAVCLYDQRLNAGGMNHFVHPLASAISRDSPRYGDCAITQLIEMMLALGGNRADLRAKIFGGAVPHWVDGASPFAVGIANARVARTLLREHAIPVVAERLGGEGGMRIYFDTWSGAVRVRRLNSAVA